MSQTVASSEQVAKYLTKYGLVVVTNLRQFVIVARVQGQPTQLEAFTIAPSEKAFRARAEGRTAFELPGFVFLYLPNDHTHGSTPGSPRPAASIADNDLAVGRVVEAVSHSAYWDDSAIFIVEDDAQDGAVHVDAHRSSICNQ